MKPGTIYIGTSGWSFKWGAYTFYPSDLPPSKQLAFYATKFPTVEINRTFYRLPTQRAFDEWKRAAPAGFLYSLKGSCVVDDSGAPPAWRQIIEPFVGSF